MSPAAQSDISMRFNAWLERFSPPRQIANNPQAMQDDATALLGIFLDHAPAEGWQDWYHDAIRRLEASMTTRAWPAPGEVVRACRGAEAPRPSGAFSSAGEAQIIGMMIDWLVKFRRPMPGYSTPARTRELIRRGALADLTEARAKGFPIFADDEAALLRDRAERRQRGESLSSILGPDEWRRHVTILARLWGCSEYDARVRAAADAAPAREPDLNRNFVASRLEGAA